MTERELEHIVDAYADMLFRIAYNYLGHQADAEDALQESFYRLCRSRKEFCSEQYLKHWLIRVTINEAKKLRRSAWFRHTVPMDAQMSERELTEASEVWEAVQALPEKYRTVVYLYYYEDFSVKEIAASLNKNPSTIQTWLMRARERLRKSLLGGEEDDT